MEFSIDIHSQLTGEITIEDFSKDYKLYIDEDDEVVTTFDLYKFSESATLNSVVKMTTTEATLINLLINDHSSDEDTCTFKVDEDGYYYIDHIVLPNKTWYENASDEYKAYYETIYITDGEKLYKEVDGALEETTIKEILERNIEGTTIKKCKVDVFFTGNLMLCYINYCKALFDALLNKCNSGEYDSDIFARDFLWMTLNILDYLIGFKLYMEAQRILENFLTCGGFCDKWNESVSCGCGGKPYKPQTGCGKPLKNCGCGCS